MRPTRLRGTFALAVAPIVAVVACSGGDGATPQIPMVKTGIATNHAIHVFVKAPDGTQARLNLAPGTELGTLSSAGAKHFDLHPLGATFAQAPTVGNATQADITSTAWALVNRAQMYCATSVSDGYIPQGAVWDVPWTQQPDTGMIGWTWFIYQTIGNMEGSCSDRLRLEENLVCIADQLGAIADAVNTTVWPALPGSTGNYTFTPDGGSALEFSEYDAQANISAMDLGNAEWDIPPQADSDRFIVRDLAIHVLGMVPTLDAIPLNLSQVSSVTPIGGVCPGGVSDCSCTSLWADLAEAGTEQTTPVSPSAITTDTSLPGNAWSNALFGVGTGTTGGCPPTGCIPAYPPSSASPSRWNQRRTL